MRWPAGSTTRCERSPRASGNPARLNNANDPDQIIVPCPHCDALNRLPRAKLADRGRCGKCHQPFFTGRPLTLDQARFERHLEKGDLPLLIDFWARWCGPCHDMAPEFERAAPELEPGMRLVKINVDE